MIIRELTIDDVEAVLEVNQKTWEVSYKSLVRDEDLKERRNSLEGRIIKWKNNFDGVFGFVAEDNGEIVAAASGKLIFDNRDIDCSLTTLYVLPSYQARGIGKLLFNEFVNCVKNKGCKTLEVWTMYEGFANEKGDRKRGPSMPFYEKLGCVRTDNIIEHRLGMTSIQLLLNI